MIDNLDLYPNMKLSIYNKWGRIVHEQSGNYLPWDGRSLNKDLPSEVYYYKIELNKQDRDPVTGNIIIIR